MTPPLWIASASVGLLIVCSVYGGLKDLASFTIPDSASILIAAAFMAASFALGLEPIWVGAHVATAIGAFILGAFLFHAGMFGGGDVKMLSAILLWIGPFGALPYLLAVGVTGGILTLVLIMGRILPTSLKERFPQLGRLVGGKHGVPYGVALAAGLLIIILVYPSLSGDLLGAYIGSIKSVLSSTPT